MLEDELIVPIRKKSLQGLDQVSVQDIHVDSCINYSSRYNEAQVPNSSCTDVLGQAEKLDASRLSSSRTGSVSFDWRQTREPWLPILRKNFLSSENTTFPSLPHSLSIPSSEYLLANCSRFSSAWHSAAAWYKECGFETHTAQLPVSCRP